MILLSEKVVVWNKLLLINLLVSNKKSIKNIMIKNEWEDHYHEYPKIQEEVREVEKSFVSIKDHIDFIAEYFSSKEFSIYHDVANWFSMAWSIKNTEYEDAKYIYEIDPYQVANDYAQHTQKLRARLLDQITIFLYTYMGFESLINVSQSSTMST